MSDIRLKATHEGELKIGRTIFHCAILEDDTRILVADPLLKAFYPDDKIPMVRLNSPMDGGTLPLPFPSEIAPDVCLVKYTSKDGHPRLGLLAKFLPQLCSAILAAREQGNIDPSLEYIVKQASSLIQGLAEVGIIALVDEATGYQDVRAKDALAKILDAYLSKEFAAWAKAFPDEFYKEMFRLNNWPFDPSSVKRPRIIGRYTNDIVYARLAPGLVEELNARNPKTTKGHRKARHHQLMTVDVGSPALSQHLHSVMALMRASANWKEFCRLLERAYPKKNQESIFNGEET